MSILDDDIRDSGYLINSYNQVLNTIDVAISAINSKITFYRNNTTILDWVNQLNYGTALSNNLIIREDTQNGYRGWIADRVRFLNHNFSLSSYMIVISGDPALLFNRTVYDGALDTWEIGITGYPTTTGYQFYEKMGTYSSLGVLSAMTHTGSTYEFDVSVLPSRADTFEFVNHYLYETPERIPESEKNTRACRGLVYQLSSFAQSINYQRGEIIFNEEKGSKLSILQQ